MQFQNLTYLYLVYYLVILSNYYNKENNLIIKNKIKVK